MTMLRMSWSTFRERWPVFVGAVVTVCLGVAIVQSSLLALVSAATARIPAGLSVTEEQELRDGYAGADALLGTTLGITTFVAAFVVSSTFGFTVAQRRRDLALLRVVGASRRQLRVLLLGEALLLGATGSGLGVLLGVPVLRVQAWMLVDLDFVPAGFTGRWHMWIIAVSVGTGVLVAVCGVWVASGRAARLRPLEALGDADADAQVMNVARWVCGAVCLAGGIAMAAVGIAVGGDTAIVLASLVAMALVAGLAAFAPLVVPLVSWATRLLAPGQLGQLAHANLRASRRRSASVAAPVMVLAALVGGLGGAFSTLGAATHLEAARVSADLVVESSGNARARIAGTAGVATVSEEVPVAFVLHRADENESGVALAVDPAAYLRSRGIEVRSGDVADLRGDTVAVAGSGHHVGDVLRARVAGREVGLRVVAGLPGTVSGPEYLLPIGLATDDSASRRYVIRLADGADPQTVAARLAPAGTVMTAAQWVEQQDDAAQRLNINVMIAVLALAVVYTVIAMVNAVVVSSSNRQGEFASARLSGLTRGQVLWMTLWESVAVVLTGLLLGGLAGSVSVYEMSRAIHGLTGLSVVSVPWPMVTAVVLGSLLIVGATSLLTTLAATRLPAIRLAGTRD